MAKINKADYLYSTSRVRYLEQFLLSSSRAERMLEARSDSEALKILSECGYREIMGDKISDVDLVIKEEREKVYKIIESFSPSDALIRYFKTKFDYHNIKTVLKGQNGQSLLGNTSLSSIAIDLGTIPFSTLSELLGERRFQELPATMAEAALNALEVLHRTGDPQLADFILDKAMYQTMLQLALETGSEFILGHARLSIDIANLRSLVRSAKMKRMNGLNAFIIPGGMIEPGKIDFSEELSDLFAGILKEAATLGTAVIKGEIGISKFEVLCDDILIRYLQEAKRVSFGEEPLFSYLAAKEAEFMTVRIIMTGRILDVKTSEIRERLRLAYV